jgi:hypothetical protein
MEVEILLKTLQVYKRLKRTARAIGNALKNKKYEYSSCRKNVRSPD